MKLTIPIITAIIGLSLNALATDNTTSPLDDVLDPNKYWKDLSEASKGKLLTKHDRMQRLSSPMSPSFTGHIAPGFKEQNSLQPKSF